MRVYRRNTTNDILIRTLSTPNTRTRSTFEGRT